VAVEAVASWVQELGEPQPEVEELAGIQIQLDLMERSTQVAGAVEAAVERTTVLAVEGAAAIWLNSSFLRKQHTR
jgi:hypothetical protein